MPASSSRLMTASGRTVIARRKIGFYSLDPRGGVFLSGNTAPPLGLLGGL